MMRISSAIPSRVALLVACCLLFAAAPSRAQDHHIKRTYKQVIEQLEDQWHQAMMANDVDTIERMLADDFIGINAQGILSTKQQTVDRIRNRQVTIHSFNVLDRKISLRGDTAIVTSEIEVDATNNATNPPTQTHNTSRTIRVYQHYPSGAWRIVNFEATRVGPNTAATMPPPAAAPAPTAGK
jgi:ketosteroid isomerase-like protein